MKVYDIVTPYTYSQKHCVVADSMGDAEKIFNKKYWPTKIIEIRLHSEYVEIQDAPQNTVEVGEQPTTQPAQNVGVCGGENLPATSRNG